MLLRKYLSLAGIGSAKIDLVLQKQEAAPGEIIEGYYVIEGGTVEQKLKRIDCDLIMDDGTKEGGAAIESTTIYSSTVIAANEKLTIPFSFLIPAGLDANANYYFKTQLSFSEGVKSKDHDLISIAV